MGLLSLYLRDTGVHKADGSRQHRRPLTNEAQSSNIAPRTDNAPAPAPPRSTTASATTPSPTACAYAAQGAPRQGAVSQPPGRSPGAYERPDAANVCFTSAKEYTATSMLWAAASAAMLRHRSVMRDRRIDAVGSYASSTMASGVSRWMIRSILHRHRMFLPAPFAPTFPQLQRENGPSNAAHPKPCAVGCTARISERYRGRLMRRKLR